MNWPVLVTGFSAAAGVVGKLANCHGGRTTGCRDWESVSSRRFCVYELLLTKEKFYKGARGYVCLRTGTGPWAWIVLLYRRSYSRIMDHEVALPLRALRRGGGTDVFVTNSLVETYSASDRI